MSVQTEVETGRFNRGAWLVYINGLEIPCPEVAVSYGVWGIPEATLTFSPHRLLQRLGNEDRVEVVIFYLDTTYQPDQPQFRILFEGEILGWSYTSMRGQRMMSFNAVADISMLTQLNFSFLNTVDAAVAALAIPGATADTIPQGGCSTRFLCSKKGCFTRSTPRLRRLPQISRAPSNSCSTSFVELCRRTSRIYNARFRPLTFLLAGYASAIS